MKMECEHNKSICLTDVKNVHKPDGKQYIFEIPLPKIAVI